VVFCDFKHAFTFSIITLLNQQVESFKGLHTKLELALLNFVTYFLTISTSAPKISTLKSEGRRFFRNRYPRPLELVFSRFTQRTYRILKILTGNSQGAQELQKLVWKPVSQKKGRIFSAYFFKILLVRCMKRLKTSTRGLGWRIRKKKLGPRSP
jgi:hypothetical protein